MTKKLVILLLLASSVFGVELVRQKNAATYIYFPIVDVNGDPVSSAAGLDSEYDPFGDGSAPDGFADLTNEATEVGSTGWYYLSITQAEMNNDYIPIRVQTSTSGALGNNFLIRTMVGDPLLIATTDDGGVVNVTGGAVDTVTTLTGHTAQTGDNYARLGAPAGASVSADIAAVKGDTADIETDTQDIQTRLPAALVSGRMSSDAVAISGSTAAADSVESNIGNLDVASSTLATADELAKVPKSDGTATWNATALASIQSESTDALNAYDPPTNTEMNARTLVSSDYFDPNNDAVANVTVVATTTTNTDMRGTDSALLAASAPTNFGDLAITASTGKVTVGTNDDKTGYALSTAGIDSIHDEEVDNDGSAISQREAWRLILSVLTGKSSGGGTTTINFRDVADTKNRISVTVDANGNRTAVGTRDGS